MTAAIEGLHMGAKGIKVKELTLRLVPLLLCCSPKYLFCIFADYCTPCSACMSCMSYERKQAHSQKLTHTDTHVYTRACNIPTHQKQGRPPLRWSAV